MPSAVRDAIAPSHKPGNPTIFTSLTVIEARSLLSIICKGAIAPLIYRN
ncbi:MAG: hypothetical protein AAGD25_14380 [Cyanobacteria bacterium P01_F01_bin.150]